MTKFITPGDIMRQTQATLRHRGYDVDELRCERLDEAGLIVGSGRVSRDGRQEVVVVVYGEPTANVMSIGFDLRYAFEEEES